MNAAKNFMGNRGTEILGVFRHIVTPFLHLQAKYIESYGQYPFTNTSKDVTNTPGINPLNA